MKCPKCGGEIPFYDLRANCKHCGVNIFYYSQDALLMEDAKRTELESASARMVIARIKTTFIGGGLQITRMIFTLIVIAALLLPIGGVKFNLPFYEGGISVGLIGVIQGFQNGILMQIPNLLQSTLFSKQTLTVVVYAALWLVLLVLDLVLFVFYLLSFLNLDKSTRHMRNLSLVASVLALIAQIGSVVVYVLTPDNELAKVTIGFGGIAVCVLFLVVFILNKALLKKGQDPHYREYDPRRKELLKQYRKGELDLSTLPLPIFESEEEHEARMKALQAMNMEEEETEQQQKIEEAVKKEIEDEIQKEKEKIKEHKGGDAQ